MTLTELKNKSAAAFERAEEYGQSPDEIIVSLQIDGPGAESIWANEEVELHYDNDGQASGCVLTAYPKCEDL